MSDTQKENVDPEMLKNLDLIMNLEILDEGEENLQLLEELDQVENAPPENNEEEKQ